MQTPVEVMCDSIALARADPSSGSVLEPSSSSSTSEDGVATPRMSTTLRMWELKVETDSSMLCWSPTSAYTPSNTGRELPSPAGRCSPDWCISARSPRVFIATVLPPVLGPVMSSVVHPGPMLRATGTASGPSRGCLALNRRTSFGASVRCPATGRTPPICALSLPLARIRSSRAEISEPRRTSSATAPTDADSSLSIRAISLSSSRISSRHALHSSTVANGSTNNVAPVFEAS